LNDLRYRGFVMGMGIGRNYRNGCPVASKAFFHQYPIGRRMIGRRLQFVKKIPVHGICEDCSYKQALPHRGEAWAEQVIADYLAQK